MYLTSAQFATAYGESELSELTGDEASVFDAAESSAASLIDGFIGSRYTLPLAAVPELVRGWAGDITRYRLWEDRAPEEVRRRYEDALAQLKLLAAGSIALPPDALGQSPGEQIAFGGYSAERIFTADTIGDY
jgi:phage gp36-like protein